MRMSKLYMPAVTLAGALALAGCGGGSGTTTTTAACPAGQERVGGVCTPATDDSAAQLAAVSTASTALTTAMAALTPAPTQAEVDTAKQEIADLKAAIAAADDVAAAELAQYNTQVAEAESLVPAFQLIVTNAATERTNAVNAEKLRLAQALYVAIGDAPATTARGSSFANTDAEDKNSLPIALTGDPFDEEHGAADSRSGGAYPLIEDGSGTAGSLSWGEAKSAEFGTAGSSDNTTNQKEHDANASFAGTYDGVKGTYTCTEQDGCESGVDGDGDTVLSSGWTFKPDNAKARVTQEVAEYGWWLDRIGAIVSDVNLFHGRKTGVATVELPVSTGVDAHIGKATYEGHALGQYAFRITGDHGSFTADAELTANFDADGDGDGTVDGTSINGKLDEFKVGTAEENRDWTVTLRTSGSVRDTAIGTSRGVATQPLPFTGDTVWDLNGARSGGQPTLIGTTGDWYADVYSYETAANLPDIVSGWFDAEHDDALMQGSFGAKSTLQD